MGSVKDYFKGLGSGFASLIKGLQVTGTEFVTPKITEYYPEDRKTYKWPERFRAILTLKDQDGHHKCTACGTCERVCPNGTIRLETKMADTWDGRKKKKLDNYWYDLGSCTFCDLCVTNCPFDALEFSNDFEQAVFTRGKLMKKLNASLADLPEQQPTPEQLAKYEADKKAKAAQAAAPAAGGLDAKAQATLDKLKAAVDAAATPEEKAAAQAKYDKIEAALKAKAAQAAPAAAAPVLDEKAQATVDRLKAAIDAASTPEEKAAAQAKYDKIVAALIAKSKK